MSKILDRIRPFLRHQINCVTCGPAALRHAMLVYGIRADIRRLARIARTTWQGTDANQLGRAAKRYGFSFDWERWRTPHQTRDALRSYSIQGTPVLMAVDRDEEPGAHWIAVIRATARCVIYCDSSRGSKILRRQTWRQFLGRACAYYPASLPRGMATTIFDLYPLNQRIDISIKQSPHR